MPDSENGLIARLKASTEQTNLLRHYGVKAIIAVVFLFVIYKFRSLTTIHVLGYSMFYSPLGVVFVGGSVLTATILWFLPPVDQNQGGSIAAKSMVFGGALVVLLILGISLGMVGGMFEKRTYAEQTMDSAVEVDTFPSVNEDNPRIAPKAVADIQTRGSVSYRQHQLGYSTISRMEDGRLAWSYSIEPDGFRNKLYENQRGVMLSDMTSMEDREMSVADAEFEHGQGMFLQRSAKWNVIKSDFWAMYYDEPIEFVHDGDPYIAYPKSGHEWHWGPIPHTTETWEGVALVHTNGTIEHLSPEEAQSSEILEGQRLYPLHTNIQKIGSLGYREGIVNQMGIIGAHKNEIEFASMPAGTGNSQPFVVDMEGERMNYVAAMEPYGETTRGLDEVWFTDARTGEMKYYGTGDDTLLGPERAIGIVRSEDSRTNWAEDGSDNGFRTVEPVPTVVDDELWWHTKVVPADNTDVTRNVFVNAHSGEAIEIHDTQAVIEFIGDADLDNATEVGTEQPTEEEQEDGVSYYIVVKDEDGNEVDRIAVRDGDETQIVQE